MHPDVRAYLVQRGVAPSHRQQRRVSAKLLHATDLVIAMNTDHQAFLFDTLMWPRAQVILQNLVSVPNTWRVECPHTPVNSGGDHDTPHH